MGKDKEDKKDKKDKSGLKFWNRKSQYGPPLLFEDPEKLWAACVEYFEWAMANPLIEEKVTVQGGEVIRYEAGKTRAFTNIGLCNYLDINLSTWAKWRNERQDLSNVIEKADRIIYQQKFEGAAADLLNPRIISRDLGLVNKVQQDHTSSDGSMTERTKNILDQVCSESEKDKS